MTTQAILNTAKYHTELASQLAALNEKNATAEIKRIQELIRDIERVIQMDKAWLIELASHNHEASHTLSSKLAAAPKGFMSRGLAWALGGGKKVFPNKSFRTEENLATSFVEEMRTNEELERNESQLAALRASLSRLQQDLRSAESIWDQLDDLYDRVFTGCQWKNEYPNEYASEQRFSAALVNLADLERQKNWDLGILECLKTAETKITEMQAQLKATIPWFEDGTGSFSSKDTHRRTLLKRIDTLFNETWNALSQVHLAHLIVAVDLSCLSDCGQKSRSRAQVYADLVAAKAEFVAVLEELRAKRHSQTQWVKSVQSGVEEAEKEVKEVQRDFREVRMTVFERVVAQGRDPPPEYKE